MGAIILLVPKFAESLEKKEGPERDFTIFMDFLFGFVFIWFALGDFISIFAFTAYVDLVVLGVEIIPIVLTFAIGMIFVGDALVKPTKNILITVAIMTVVWFPISFFLFHSPLFVGAFEYSFLLGAGIILGLLFVGVVMAHFIYLILYKKKETFNRELWQTKNLSRISNSSYLLGTLLILGFIESFLQLMGLTMAAPLLFLL